VVEEPPKDPLLEKFGVEREDWVLFRPHLTDRTKCSNCDKIIISKGWISYKHDLTCCKTCYEKNYGIEGEEEKRHG